MRREFDFHRFKNASQGANRTGRVEMKSKQVFSLIDYETYSEADLKKVGAYEYANHPSSEILCVAWRTGTFEELRDSEEGDTGIWAPWLDGTKESNFPEFLKLILDTDIKLVAHNAFFEQCVTRLIFAERLMYSMRDKILKATRPSRFICTSARASALALPPSLEHAAKALKLEHQKDKEGSNILKKFMKPRNPTKNNASTRLTYADNPEEFMRLIEYCKRDISAEVELFVKTPPLTPYEQKLWELDQKINFRGIPVDRRLIRSARKLIKEERLRLLEEVKEETYGVIDSLEKSAQVLPFLAGEGLVLPNMKKETIAAALENPDVYGVARRVLEIRQELSLSSLKKFHKLSWQSKTGDRLRGQFFFHGASTGRWAGRGVNPQNLPRPAKSIKDTYYACETARRGDAKEIYQLYGNVLQMLPSTIRGCVYASEGKTLFVGDYNAIEPRVLFWLSGDEDGLRAFIEHRPIYEEQAAAIFNKTPKQIVALGDGSFERFIGKQTFIGSGYGMGAAKFKLTIEGMGREITKQLAETAISSYRKLHPKVVRFWRDLEKAAINAINKPGKRFDVGRLHYIREGDFLYCGLPSGRRIAYHRPEVRHEPTPWGEPRPKIYFWGVDAKRKGVWSRQTTYGGSLAENVVQAVSRDLLGNAMFECEAGGYKTLLHAHDELASEASMNDSNYSLEDFFERMSRLPDWAEGLPVLVKGYSNRRYRKD
jgi:DNA polymerase